jgi:ABC-2 type transport system ATP-binding protein
MTAADPQMAVAAVDLTKRFAAVTAVDQLSLQVDYGEIFGLLGPDGAGKTTTLRMLSGLMDPDEGHAQVAGIDTKQGGASLRDAIGYMAQRFGLYGDLTVAENMQFFSDIYGLDKTVSARLGERLLAMTRMAEFTERPAAKLSGGMKQKLALMCALLHKPRILFLDEPTNGVDPVSRRDFWIILNELVASERLTIFVTTTYLDEAEHCHRVALLHKGKLVRMGAPAQLRASIIERCFAVRGEGLRAARPLLAAAPGVVSAEPAGEALHVFLDPAFPVPLQLVPALQWTPMTPTLEDLFILEMKRVRA